jgi:hypothetical protein
VLPEQNRMIEAGTEHRRGAPNVLGRTEYDNRRRRPRFISPAGKHDGNHDTDPRREQQDYRDCGDPPAKSSAPQVHRAS